LKLIKRGAEKKHDRSVRRAVICARAERVSELCFLPGGP
jgi:hypothetical protein